MKALLPLLLLASSAPAAPPSVLVLFTDDQRADTIHALGNAHIQTPNLDRLVNRGISFDRAYMQGGLGGATCVTSRAMLLTGMPMFRVDEKIQRDKSWPKAFADVGYVPFLSGKWHNGANSVPLSFPTARGVFTGGMTDPREAKLIDVTDGILSKPYPTPKHACAVFADNAVDFLNSHKGPFFCYVPFNGPHDPHIVPDGFPVEYDAKTQPLPANFLPQHPFDNGDMTLRDERLLPWPRTPASVRQMNADYYRYMTYLDAQIGRILDALDASPHADSTYVVFTSDSGVARGSHGLIGKQNLYEHSMRVPLIVSGPGVAKNVRTRAMCYLFDLLPTIGKLCGVPAPATSEGIDLSAILADPSKPGRERLLFAYRNVQRAVRDERYKLIHYPQVDVTQLFDLQTDPDEMVNLASEPDQRERVAAMLASLATEQAKFGDTLPLSVAKPKPAAWVPPTPRD